MNVDAVRHRDGDPREIDDVDPVELAGLQRRVELGAGQLVTRDAEHDLRSGALRQVVLEVSGVAFGDLGEACRDSRRILDGRRVGHDGRAGASRRQVRDPGHRLREQDLAGLAVDGRQLVIRGGDDRGPDVGHQQVPDRMVHDREVGDVVEDGTRGGIREQSFDPTGADASVIEADDELERLLVVGQRRRADRREGADGLAGAQVEGADLVAGRDMEALTRAVAGRLGIVATWLDDGRACRHAELALAIDMVRAPEDDPARHRVLGQVRMRPFVDLLVDAVAPRLQELGRGPCVIDLVEVHLVGLRQPEQAKAERGQYEDDEDPHIEAVEAAAALPDEQPAAVGPDRLIAEASAEPADESEIGEGHRRRPAGHPHHRRRRDDHRRGRRTGHGRGGSGGSGGRGHQRCGSRHERARPRPRPGHAARDPPGGDGRGRFGHR